MEFGNDNYTTGCGSKIGEYTAKNMGYLDQPTCPFCKRPMQIIPTELPH